MGESSVPLLLNVMGGEFGWWSCGQRKRGGSLPGGNKMSPNWPRAAIVRCCAALMLTIMVLLLNFPSNTLSIQNQETNTPPRAKPFVG